MAVEPMCAYKPGAPAIARVAAHDLEGYYYVILSLGFMFTSPYVLKALPGERDVGDADHYLKIWLEHTTGAIPIWQEADKKKRFFCTHEGFEEIERRLGREWSCEPIKEMLRELRNLLFYSEPAKVTHSGMIRIIQDALDKLSTDPDHAKLCQPVPMTQQWVDATGSPGPNTRDPRLPALRMNVLHHEIGQGKDSINLFARMPRPPLKDEVAGAGGWTGTTVNKRAGMKTVDRFKIVAPRKDQKPRKKYVAA
jgi:hypothetical protein